MARANNSCNNITGFFVLTAQMITVLFGKDMSATRKRRTVDRAANEWFRWEDEESQGWEGDDIFALRDLFSRAEEEYEREEMCKFLRGEHLQGGEGSNTPRAEWIRGRREERRQLDQEAEERLKTLALDDLWNLRILFGAQAPDSEPTSYELDWTLECWG